MLRIGLPAGGEFALISVYMVLVYDITRHFGSSAQGGFGIGVRVMQAMFLPAVAIAFATAPRPFREGVVEASAENVKAALGFVQGLEATGGTAIHVHTTMHFQGRRRALDAIARALLNVGLEEIERALKHP